MSAQQFLLKTGHDPVNTKADPTAPMPELRIFNEGGYQMDFLQYITTLQQSNNELSVQVQDLNDRVAALENP